MKKIIWVFGESATGKKTFIENILSNKNDIRDMFDFGSNRIVALKRTILSAQDEAKEIETRYDAIINGITDFLNNSDEVLLIKGQTDDLDYEEGNDRKMGTLLKSIDMFPEIDMSIILLEIPNNDISYDRMQQKDWWKMNPEKYSAWIPRNKWDLIVERHINKVMSFEKYGINIEKVDTTNGYKIIERKNVNGKSSSIRR